MGAAALPRLQAEAVRGHVPKNDEAAADTQKRSPQNGEWQQLLI